MNTRETYNQYGEAYHQKRLREHDSIYNRYLDQPMIEKLLGPNLEQQQILDLGCGSGLLSKALIKKGAQVSGIDFSDTLIEIANHECPEGDFRLGNINDLPFPDLSFDVVVSALVFHYEQDLLPGFSEAKRVLQRNGRFIFTIHHPIQEVLEKDDDPSSRRLRPYFHNEAYDWEMLESMSLRSYHHTFETISEALFKAGFAIEQIVEARAPEALKTNHPRIYDDTRDYPSFCGFKAFPI